MIAPEFIVAEGRTWLDTSWRHQARVKGLAADCIGVIGGIAVNCEVPGAREWLNDPSLHNYGRIPKPDFLVRSCDRFLIPIALSAIQLADILVMAFRRYPQHFALVSRIDPIYLIHGYASVGRCVENGVHVARARVVRAYRFPGVA